MIAHRFRPVVWVAGCAFAATALYTVSLSVASERTRLEDVNRQIAMTQRDIRQLQTELGTRASLRQLERWNGEVLALAAPSAGQFRATEAALRTIDGGGLPGNNFAPPPVMVAAATSTVSSGLVQTAALQSSDRPAAIPAPVVKAMAGKPAAPAAVSAKADSGAKAAKPAKPAGAEQPRTAKAQRFAMLDRALVDQRTFTEIMARAENESQSGGGKGKSAQ